MFASVSAIGGVADNARVSVAGRSRELATLRDSGFTRAEIALILLGELAVRTRITFSQKESTPGENSSKPA